MNIPIDILQDIFFLVNITDYASLARSCHHFSTLLLEENLWRKLCLYYLMDHEGSYINTFKMSMVFKWYRDDRGMLEEVKKGTKITPLRDPVHYFGNKLNRINNKFCIKVIASHTYFSYGLNCSFKDVTEWNSVAYGHLSLPGVFVYRNPVKFVGVVPGDIVTISIDYDNECISLIINDITILIGKSSFYAHKSIKTYIILNNGEIELL